MGSEISKYDPRHEENFDEQVQDFYFGTLDKYVENNIIDGKLISQTCQYYIPGTHEMVLEEELTFYNINGLTDPITKHVTAFEPADIIYAIKVKEKLAKYINGYMFSSVNGKIVLPKIKHEDEEIISKPDDEFVQTIDDDYLLDGRLFSPTKQLLGESATSTILKADSDVVGYTLGINSNNRIVFIMLQLPIGTDRVVSIINRKYNMYKTLKVLPRTITDYTGEQTFEEAKTIIDSPEFYFPEYYYVEKEIDYITDDQELLKSFYDPYSKDYGVFYFRTKEDAYNYLVDTISYDNVE